VFWVTGSPRVVYGSSPCTDGLGWERIAFRIYHPWKVTRATPREPPKSPLSNTMIPVWFSHNLLDPTRTLVWLCLSTKFLIWQRSFWNSFLLTPLVPPHKTTASCFVKVLVSLITVCVIAVRSDRGFTMPWISKSLSRLSQISETIHRVWLSPTIKILCFAFVGFLT